MNWETFLRIWMDLACELQRPEPVCFPVPAGAREISYGPSIDPISLRPAHASAGVCP